MRKSFLVLFMAMCMFCTFPTHAQDNGGLTVEQIIQWVLSTLPHPELFQGAPVFYTRVIRESLPGEYPIGTQVGFTALPSMGINLVGAQAGMLTGYNFVSPPNVKPNSFTGAFNRADWARIQYIVQYLRPPCPPDVLHCDYLGIYGEVYLDPGQVVIALP